MKLKFLIVIGLGLTINNISAQERIGTDVVTAMKLADADILKANITYLADDKLLGRQPGKPGYKMAVDYVVGELQKNGVQPASEKGTWLQPAGVNNPWLQTILMRRAAITPGLKASITIKGTETILVDGKDLTLTPNPIEKQSSVNAAVVFAGYGISAPGLNYDDYSGIKVKGKVVLVVRGAPLNFPASDASHHQNAVTVQKNALAHGAIGVIYCTLINSERGMLPSRSSNSMLDHHGKIVVSSTYPFEKIKVVGTLGYAISNTFFTSEGKEMAKTADLLKKGEPQSFASNVMIKVAYESNYTDFVTFNVAGKIEGSDKKLKNEYVVHSAHLDHMGIGRAVEGDSIYNGAHDNASGVSSLLQITKIYQGLKVKPKRSVLILMVTGEEMGLLGSSYFAALPTVPIKKIVANVNTDMPTIIAPLLSVTALGAEHSTLINPVKEAASYFGLDVEPDPEPKENRFVRSDQYSFIKQGIPALHIKYGNKTADGKNNLNLFVEKWRAKYYHKPQDDINGVFDFEAGRKYAQLNFLIGYLVANDEQRPNWNSGDIFEKKK